MDHPCGAFIDGSYRYRLWRTLEEVRTTKRVLFVMLNPSTADEHRDDPTLRRCIGFAKQWGFRRVDVCNLFAYRSSSPRVLRTAVDPVGPLNDGVLREVAAEAALTVVAWGADGKLGRRGDYVAATVLRKRALYCLGRTRSGEPRHPLYVPRSAELIRYA